MRTLLIATTNRGKVAELERLLAGSGWRVRPLPADVEEFEETGTTFAENARGKALWYCERLGLPALADDSGLVVDALGGEPGVYSARYIDPGIDQATRNRKLLERLADEPDERRTARFVCHLALADRRRVVHETTGVCEGRITHAPGGSGGFGYDPIFFSPELGKTFAEATRDEKAAVSHRGRAMRDMVEHLSPRSSGPSPSGVS